MPEWLALDSPLVGWLAVASPVLFFGTLLVVPELVVRMRADYFVSKRAVADGSQSHPGIRIVARALKNGFGLLLLLVGVAMLVLPGQGLLTILVALALLEFPGKRRLELALVRRPLVLRAINGLRRRRQRPPIEVPTTERNGAPKDA